MAAVTIKVAFCVDAKSALFPDHEEVIPVDQRNTVSQFTGKSLKRLGAKPHKGGGMIP